MKKDIPLLKICIFYLSVSLILVVYILGFNNLSPNNLDWLMSGDRLGELIGWLNFKNANWNFPLGNYSQELLFFLVL